MTTSHAGLVDHGLVERYVRSYARGNMRDTVRIYRMSEPVFDPVTGGLAPSASPDLYSGPARVYSVTGPVTYSLGDEPQHFSSTYISVPVVADDGSVNEVPAVEDMIEVLACPGDASMVGRTFQVQDVEAAGQWTAVRRMQVVGVQEAPSWRPS